MTLTIPTQQIDNRVTHVPRFLHHHNLFKEFSLNIFIKCIDSYKKKYSIGMLGYLT